MDRDLPLRVGISRVEWGRWYASKTQMKIFVDDQLVYDETVDPAGKEQANDFDMDGNEFQKSPTSDCKVEVFLEVLSRDFASGRPRGAWRFDGTPIDLNGEQHELGGENPRQAKVTIRFLGLPVKPDLPAWKE